MSPEQAKIDALSVDKYHVRKRSFNRGSVVSFKCPTCSSSLNCDLADAGNVEHCPHCASAFTAPGLDELKAEQAESDRRRDEERRIAEREQRQIIRSAPPAPQPTRSSSVVPAYPMAGTLIVTLIVFACISLAGGVFLLAAGIFSGVGALALVPLSLAFIGAGIMLLWTADFYRMFRDVAINSWHMRRSLEREQRRRSS